MVTGCYSEPGGWPDQYLHMLLSGLLSKLQTIKKALCNPRVNFNVITTILQSFIYMENIQIIHLGYWTADFYFFCSLPVINPPKGNWLSWSTMLVTMFSHMILVCFAIFL